MRNSKLLVLIVCAFLIGGAIGYSVAQRNTALEQLETTKIKIGGLPIAQGLPIFLALQKGYFKNAGIDAEFVKFEAPNQLVDAILSGNIDITHTGGAMGIAVIANFKNPGKLAVYAAAGGNKVIPNDSILVGNASDIASIQDLKGKKLGILPGIQWKTIARHILAQNNLIADTDVTIVELAPGLQAPALASGEIDGLLAIEPMPTIVKEKNIGKEIVHTPTALYVANPFYGGAGILNLEFARENPKLIKKVLAIIAQSVQEINKNPDEARIYLKGYTPLEDNLIAKLPVPLFKMSVGLSKTDIDAIQQFLDIFTEYKVVDGKMDVEKLLYATMKN